MAIGVGISVLLHLGLAVTGVVAQSLGFSFSSPLTMKWQAVKADSMESLPMGGKRPAVAKGTTGAEKGGRANLVQRQLGWRFWLCLRRPSNR